MAQDINPVNEALEKHTVPINTVMYSTTSESLAALTSTSSLITLDTKIQISLDLLRNQFINNNQKVMDWILSFILKTNSLSTSSISNQTTTGLTQLHEIALWEMVASLSCCGVKMEKKTAEVVFESSYLVCLNKFPAAHHVCLHSFHLRTLSFLLPLLSIDTLLSFLKTTLSKRPHPEILLALILRIVEASKAGNQMKKVFTSIAPLLPLLAAIPAQASQSPFLVLLPLIFHEDHTSAYKTFFVGGESYVRLFFENLEHIEITSYSRILEESGNSFGMFGVLIGIVGRRNVREKDLVCGQLLRLVQYEADATQRAVLSGIYEALHADVELAPERAEFLLENINLILNLDVSFLEMDVIRLSRLLLSQTLQTVAIAVTLLQWGVKSRQLVTLFQNIFAEVTPNAFENKDFMKRYTLF